MTQIPVHRLILEKGKGFDLVLVAGERGLSNPITMDQIHRPGLAFAGFLDVFTYDRIQVLGNTEISYLLSLSPEERWRRIAAVMEYRIPCIIVTAGNQPPPEMVELANRHNVPLMRTTHETTQFVAHLSFWLEREFAPSTNVHGVLVDVFGVGVLMMGGSGVGKSECGLELIERGHRLVADDVVVIRRLGSNILMGSSASAIQHHMEVRGLGIIDVELLFGIGAVREEKRISLVCELEKWTDDLVIDRLGIDTVYRQFLDVPVRQFHIPVESGRNISILIEVAALQHRILERGRNPAEELNQRIMQQMRRDQPRPPKPDREV
jgi:HPr kinase/phosphorylase